MTQTLVQNAALGSGQAGEIATTYPRVTETLILNSANPNNNAQGIAFTYVEGNSNECGAGASDRFAGLITMPKNIARDSLNESNSFAPLANGTVVEILRKGFVWQFFPSVTPVAKGNYVIYNVTTGFLTTINPSEAMPTDHVRVPGGEVVQFNEPSLVLTQLVQIYIDFAGDKTSALTPAP